ncbi:MAG: FKBP-type peptidyl-prolyl cis-trans isomerase [Bacteroidota bacterium]|nr:FKBP-type peptidyl-prolyl cis-trans isomerase [Bacteroidota bacterium]
MKADQAKLRAEDPQAFERELIFKFLDRLGDNWQQWGTSAIHFAIEGITTDTAGVVKGDIVTISYTGKRLEDGSEFDSTEKNGGPMTFRFGDKDQVINGLEIAVLQLREGQQGEFLFPSEYAFGARGIESMIDPYTPVIYTVRLEEVQRAGTSARNP